MKDVINLDPKITLPEVKKNLRELKITKKDDAINILNLLSAIGSAEKSLKEKAYKKLDECAECEVYESSNGNMVQKVEFSRKTFISDEYLEELLLQKKEIDQQIKDYKKELEDRKQFTIKTGRYYKSV